MSVHASSHVFTYGSQMFAPVWQRVVRGRYRSVRAAVRGYARFAIRDAGYPGMIAQADGAVEGVLYLDVGADDLARLDAFEGPEYRRQTVAVLPETGATAAVQASTYLYLAADRLTAAPWEPESFRIDSFMAAHCP